MSRLPVPQMPSVLHAASKLKRDACIFYAARVATRARMRQTTWALVLACLFAEALAKCTPLRARSLAAAASLRGGVEPIKRAVGEVGFSNRRTQACSCASTLQSATGPKRSMGHFLGAKKGFFLIRGRGRPTVYGGRAG